MDSFKDEGKFYSKTERCVVCDEYKKGDDCGECPFAKFVVYLPTLQRFKKEIFGCYVWMSMVIDEKLLFYCAEDKIVWRKKDHQAVAEQIERLKAKAMELIETYD